MNIIFVYHNEFSKYIKVEWATLTYVFDYLFDIGAEKFLSEKGKKYLLGSLEKWDSEHLWFDEDFDNYPDNDGLEDIIGDEGM